GVRRRPRPVPPQPYNAPGRRASGGRRSRRRRCGRRRPPQGAARQASRAGRDGAGTLLHPNRRCFVGTLNGKRVIAGGVVAGLAALVAELLVEPLAGAPMEAWLSGLGLEPPGEAVMLAYLVTAVVLGVVMVWLYAAARPRLGPGPST